jgi:hypothetical protein
VATQPIAPRAGRPAPEDMRSYLPSAVRLSLHDWLATWLLGQSDKMVQRAVLVTAGLDLDLPPGRSDWAYGEIKAYGDRGDEELLDTVHVTLGVLRTENTSRRPPQPYEEVDRILAIGRSAWSAAEKGLVHRTDPTAQVAFEVATATPGSASTELKEAWAQAHARNGNASDAWDHAIKAVEAVLIPIVVSSKNNRATLGTVIRDLRAQSHVWKFGIRGQNQDHSIDPLIAMLTLLWPDPNRHGSPTPEPDASPEEARAIANLAVTIVQWAKDGLII